MEVHTHSPTERKKWFHYLWEFLMLFLAVFCGFLAENFREHKVEQQRAKQFALSLYDEIKQDTATVNVRLLDIPFSNSRIDTFINLVQIHEPADLPGGTWYYYGRWGTRYFNISFQDATIYQLKNSGGLRYFHNSSIVKAIAQYDQACRNLLSELGKEDLSSSEVLGWRNKLFNAYYMTEIMSLNLPYNKIDSFKQRHIPLLTMKKYDFIQYANVCQMRMINNFTINQSYNNVSNKANELLLLLKKEYHLE